MQTKKLSELTEKDVADMKALFNKVADPSNWKEPTKKFVSRDYKEARAMQEAIIFFVGGAEFETSEILLRHPAGLVTFTEYEYTVSSKGYYFYIGA